MSVTANEAPVVAMTDAQKDGELTQACLAARHSSKFLSLSPESSHVHVRSHLMLAPMPIYTSHQGITESHQMATDIHAYTHG